MTKTYNCKVSAGEAIGQMLNVDEDCRGEL